jgi:AcrR family transcriptional regulator
MEESVAGRPTKYKSDSIMERRERILRVARKMIAQSGVAELSVRELCARAGIAQKTLYNAFGSKDHVITLAVTQYTQEFNNSVYYKFPRETLEGQIERMIKVHSRNTQLRSYTTAIMSVYNSAQSDRELRNAVRLMSTNAYKPFVEMLSEEKGLQTKVTPEHITAYLTTNTYATLTDWCIGDIEDQLLVERVCEGFLMIVAASTRGKHKADAEQWLGDLRNSRSSWMTFRKMAEVEPGELRAAFLQTHKAKQQGQADTSGTSADKAASGDAAGTKARKRSAAKAATTVRRSPAKKAVSKT